MSKTYKDRRSNGGSGRQYDGDYEFAKREKKRERKNRKQQRRAREWRTEQVMRDNHSDWD